MLNTNFVPSLMIGGNASTASYPTPSAVYGGINDRVMMRLAKLSQQKQWIFYTAQCPRPQYHQLAAYQIQCEKIIHLKASQTRSEIEIVMKAIQSNNASAIVASGDIDLISQKLLAHMAAEHQCEVFFLTSSTRAFH
ncbi:MULTISPECIES: hypothetical protein [unclassified Vibrio]|uniref:hypothetical protein n=1 Tax=unclassified Vibrio TaxID=2614977 RepID=UPI001EF0585F|nr:MULTISPECIES: hypothetical protein [unclassified Vibrio]